MTSVNLYIVPLIYAALASKTPSEVYDQYLDMGVSMIQTDRPQMLLEYLRSRGRHD